MRKGACLSLFILRGTFASDAAATALNENGVGAPAVGMVYNERVKYQFFYPAGKYTMANQQIPGFPQGGAQYPAPILMNQPISAIATGVATQAARVYAATGANENPYTIPERNMIDQ